MPVKIFVVFFILALAFFLLSGLVALLTTLTGLAVLARLSGLSALLFVFFHIVCHEIVLPLERATCALCDLNRLPFLVAVGGARVARISGPRSIEVPQNASMLQCLVA